MKYIIFHNGIILSQIITDNIVAAAKRGKITEAGKKVLLVPDKRHGSPNAAGYYDFSPTKIKECIPLKSLCLG